MVALAAVLVFTRTPGILIHGRLFAEEGVLYFRDAVAGTWYDALLAPRVGYFSAFNKLAALAATLVPLEQAPLVTTWSALLVQLCVVWMIARSDAFGPPWGRAAAALAPLLAVPSVEVWLTTISSQFHLAVGTAVLLATGPAALPATFRLGFLLLAGATGPVAATLAPLFVLKAYGSRSRQDIREAALLCGLAAVQGALLIQGLAGGDRTGGLAGLAVLAALGIKNLAFPWLGAPAVHLAALLLAGSRLMKGVVVAGLAAFAAVVVAPLLRTRAARWLLAAALLIALVSYAGALGKDPWLLVLPTAAGRYAYAPNVLVLLALIAAAADGTNPRRLLAKCLAAWLCVGGLAQFWKGEGYFRGPSWRAEVAAWREDPTRPHLAIWPSPWTLTLPR